MACSFDKAGDTGAARSNHAIKVHVAAFGAHNPGQDRWPRGFVAVRPMNSFENVRSAIPHEDDARYRLPPPPLDSFLPDAKDAQGGQ